MDPTSPRRLLVGFHTFGHSYMHVPPLLRRTGLAVDAVFTEGHVLARSTGLARRFVVPPAEWAAEVERRLLSGEYLRFFNVDEPGLRALYARAWHPDASALLPLPPESDVVATIGSKWRFHQWCLKHALPVPETRTCGSFQDAVRARACLPGHWILKGDSGSGGQSVLRNVRDVEGDCPDAIEPREWLIQEDGGCDIGSGIFFAEGGRLLAWIGIRKVICLRKGYGPTVLGRGDTSPELGDLCRRVAAASRVTGLTGFDFVQVPGRGPLLIDSHLGRMSPMQHFDSLYGVDFASAIRAALGGHPADAPAPAGSCDFIKFPEILQLIGEGDAGAVLRHMRRPLRMPLTPRGDPMTGIRCAFQTAGSQARVSAGALRKKLFRRPPTAGTQPPPQGTNHL